MCLRIKQSYIIICDLTLTGIFVLSFKVGSMLRRLKLNLWNENIDDIDRETIRTERIGWREEQRQKHLIKKTDKSKVRRRRPSGGLARLRLQLRRHDKAGE